MGECKARVGKLGNIEAWVEVRDAVVWGVHPPWLACTLSRNACKWEEEGQLTRILGPSRTPGAHVSMAALRASSTHRLAATCDSRGRQNQEV